MIFHQQTEVPVNISIVSISNSPHQIIKEFFPNEQKYIKKDEFFEGAWETQVMNSLITNDNFENFLMKLPKQLGSFDITINNESNNIYESFSHISGTKYITKKYLPKEYVQNKSAIGLIGILFNLQEKKIELT